MEERRGKRRGREESEWVDKSRRMERTGEKRIEEGMREKRGVEGEGEANGVERRG